MSGLYIHIPFCHSKCAYCDFHSFPVDTAIGRYVSERYIEALRNELKLRHHELPEPPTTVYIGGGTPSILPPANLRQIIDDIDLTHTIEFTVEANPEDITPDWTQAMVSMGVNRVSIGVQSLNDHELSTVGRRHNATQAIEAIHTLHANGIHDISADLIYGLPGQTVSSWSDSVKRLLDTPITHMSAYSLMYEPGTRLTAMLNSGRITAVDDSTEHTMYDLLISQTDAAGFIHYEISNFARPEYRARHNSGYWDFTPYLGLGPGAHSFDGRNIRRSNPDDSRLYVNSLLKHHTVYQQETETPDDQLNDLIITSLRTIDGLSLNKIDTLMGNGEVQSLLDRARKHIDCGHLMIENGTLHIPQCHWLISNAILRDIIK